MKIKHTSLQEIADSLIKGIENAYENCPDAKNKTFEEVAQWAGENCILTEDKQEIEEWHSSHR